MRVSRDPLQVFTRLFSSSSSSGSSAPKLTLLAFGSGSFGALGLGGTINADQYEPVAVPGLPKDVVACGAGHFHSLAVAQGQLFSFGRQKEWQLGRPLAEGEYDFSPTPAPVTAGGLDRHSIAYATGSGVATFAVTTDGLLYSFGSSSRGQLGLGIDVPVAREPRRVRLPGKVKQVSAGWGHCAAVLDDGRLFTWGWPANGRLAHTFAADACEELEEQALKQRCVWEPQQVDLLNGVKVRSVACGFDHTLIMTQDGNLLSFGDNSLGQLGRLARPEGEHIQPPDASACLVHGPSVPFKKGGGAIKELKFKRLAAGLGHNLGVMTDGSVVSFGWNNAHQLGLGEVAEGDIVATPTCIYGIANNPAAIVAAGRVHSVLVTDDVRHSTDSGAQPRAYNKSWPCLTMTHTWGSAANGRLGTGTYESSAFPELVPELDGEAVVDVACGLDHTLVLAVA